MTPYYSDSHSGITIYHGDMRDVLPRINSIERPKIITDPPYNAGKNYGVGTNDRQEWPDWCRWWDECLGVMMAAAPDVLAFLSQTAYRKYLRLGTYEPDWAMAWVKPLALSVCAMPFMPHWEPIAYWGKTRKRDKAFWGSDVVSCNVSRNEWGHPTEKPLLLMRQLVSRFDGTVIDPFLGSGTTLVAAKQLNRRAVGIEISEAYCQVAVRRLQQEVFDFASLDGVRPSYGTTGRDTQDCQGRLPQLLMGTPETDGRDGQR